jgi:hypothetical protein
MNKTTNKILSIDIDLFEQELPEANAAQIRESRKKAVEIIKAIDEYEESKIKLAELIEGEKC